MDMMNDANDGTIMRYLNGVLFTRNNTQPIIPNIAVELTNICSMSRGTDSPTKYTVFDGRKKFQNIPHKITNTISDLRVIKPIFLFVKL